MGNGRTFLGLLYVTEALIKKGLLHKDPDNPNNILIYRTGGNEGTEGWYSENIHSAMNETWHNREELEEFLSLATENGVDVEKCFTDARLLLG